MRSTFILILLSLSFVLPAQAQSASLLKKHRKLVKRSARKGFSTYSLDTIYHAGKAQMVLKAKGNERFHVYDLGGKQLFDVKRNPGNGPAPRYAVYKFVPNPSEVAYVWEGVNWDLVQKTITNNDIMQDGYFNAEKWAEFLSEHPMPQPQNPSQNRGTITKVLDKGMGQLTYSGQQLVERDRSQPVTMVGGEIFQDGKLIGTYKKTQESRAEQLHDIYRIFYLSGQISVTVNVRLEGMPRSVALLPNNGGSLEYQTQNVQVILADLVARNYL